MAEGRSNEPGGGLGQGQRLVFEGFPDAAEAAVDGGANSDFGFMIGDAHKRIVNLESCFVILFFGRRTGGVIWGCSF